MNKVFGVLGALLFIAAVVVGNFAKIPAATPIEIALAAFALAATIMAAVSKAKEESKFSWKTILSICLAVAGGVLCCIGGLSNSVFAEISGLVLALIAIIAGIVAAKKA